jgi:hypothetical protein
VLGWSKLTVLKCCTVVTVCLYQHYIAAFRIKELKDVLGRLGLSKGGVKKVRSNGDMYNTHMSVVMSV